MKTIILTVEIKVDERQIARKYPNFAVNYGLGRDNLRERKIAADFCQRSNTGGRQSAGFRIFGKNYRHDFRTLTQNQMKRKKIYTHHYSIKTVCLQCRLVLWNGKDIIRHEESCGVLERRGVTEIINQTGANERVIIHRK